MGKIEIILFVARFSS